MIKIKIIPESIQLIRMSDTEYFSDKYSEYLSNSKIGLLNPEEKGSIENFIEGYDSKYNDSFALGSAVHCRVLQKDEFEVASIQKPNSKLGIFVEKVFELRQKGFQLEYSIKRASKEVDYYSKGFSATRIKTAIKSGLSFYLKRLNYQENEELEIMYLSEGVFDKYNLCVESIDKSNFDSYINPQGIFDTPESYNEYAVLCDLEVEYEGITSIIKIKGKIDNFTICHEKKEITLNDLKTSGKPVNYFMGNYVPVEGVPTWYDGSFQRFHYYRQFGLYAWLLKAALKQTKQIDYPLNANVLVVESIPEYNTKIYRITNSHIQAGLEEFKELVKIYVGWKNNL